jgi:hypothetical protein
MKKRLIVTHFTTKIIRTHLYITCNKNILFVKKYQLISGVIGMNCHTRTRMRKVHVPATLFLSVRV